MRIVLKRIIIFLMTIVLMTSVVATSSFVTYAAPKAKATVSTTDTEELKDKAKSTGFDSKYYLDANPDLKAEYVVKKSCLERSWNGH